MLKVTKLAAGQELYYESQVAKGMDDYYSGKGEAPGEWRGRLASELGLQGRVSAQAFSAMLAGFDPRDPAAKRALRDVQQESKVAAYDLTFSAPKSVSVLAVVAPAEVSRVLRDSHEAAVSAALDYLEDESVRVRRGKGGKEVEQASGLVSASYRHRMSRAKDPHLHTHVVTAALTRGKDGRWTSLDARPLYRTAKAAGTIYQAHLRAEVGQRLGLSWGPVRDGLSELEGISGPVLEHFSQRRAALRDAAKERGLDLDSMTIGEREALALQTRAAKDEPFSAVEHQAWLKSIRARAAEQGLDRQAVSELLAGRGIGAQAGDDDATFGDTADVLAGPSGLTLNANAFERRDAIVAVACGARQGLRGPQLRGMVQAFEQRGDVLSVEGTELDPRWTTADLVACEQRLIAKAVGRAGEGASKLAAGDVGARLSASDRMLNRQQGDALRAVTTSGNGVDVIEARAGTGKTYLAGALREVWEAEEGLRVIGVAPTGAAARTLRDEAQIKSWTLQSVLGEIERFGGLQPGTIVILDEAGMADTRHVEQLLSHCQEAGVKVVAIGDSGQLPSVRAGGWLSAVGGQVGRHELTETLRQRSVDERRALGALHAGEPAPWIEFAKDEGRLFLARQSAAAAGAAVSAWEAAVAEHGLTEAVLITRDNAMRQQLNAQARERRMYELGESRDFGPVQVAEGDRIICRRNDRRVDVDNGTRGTVRAVCDERIVLETDGGALRDLPASYVSEHVEHAYALTGHGMQGATVEWAGVVATPAHLTRGWSYTALSRAKGTTNLYVLAGETPAARSRADELDAAGPQLKEPAPTVEAVLERVAQQMTVRDDEDLAVDQLPDPFVAGSAADRELVAAADVATPVQERGAEPQPPAGATSPQERLAELRESVDRASRQLKALPLTEIRRVEAAEREQAKLRANRRDHARRLAELPPPGRLRDSHADERRHLQYLLASTDERLAAVDHTFAVRCADVAKKAGRDPQAVREEQRGLTARTKELRSEEHAQRDTIVNDALGNPPQWVRERLGERPADNSPHLGAWKRGVREGVRAQLQLDPRADLNAGLPPRPPVDAHLVETWEQGTTAIAEAAADLGRGPKIPGPSLGHGID